MNDVNAIYTLGSSETFATLTWTISESGCASNSDNINIQVFPEPFVSAGTDVEICEGTTTVQLGATGTGSWSGGTGSFSNANSPTAIYTLGSSETTAVLTWTVVPTSGPCASASDNITVNVSTCLLYTSPSPRDATLSRMPSSA